MTKAEKGMIAGLITTVILFIGSVYLTGKAVDDAGGIKGIVIAVGKEIKDISREIDKH